MYYAFKSLNTKGELKSARIQVFNFKVTYKKGSKMTHVDALSRIPNSNDKAINEVKEIDPEKIRIIMNVHEKLAHRGAKAVHEELKILGHTDIKINLCREVLNKCHICKLYNPTRVMRHIQAYKVREIVAYGIIGPYEENYIVTAIDYFSRKAFAEILKDRTSEGILKFLKKVQQRISISTLVSDCAKENKSKIISLWCKSESITQHFTTPHHHCSNGRIERFNRTLQKGLNKQFEEIELRLKIDKCIDVYNNTQHSAIGMSPNQALNPKSREEVKRNQLAHIIKQHKKLLADNKRKYAVGELVFIKDEKIRIKGQPRFYKVGTIIEVGDYDTYKI